MIHFSAPVRASCTCGAVQVAIHGAMARLYCHCSICQRVNDAPFGDPVFMYRWQMQVADPAQLAWSRHRWTPINVSRGHCRTCGQLVVETLTASPLAVVVGRTWEAPEHLPPAQGHLFYESRVEDVDDGLPKWSGYLASQVGATRCLVAGMFGGV